MKKRIGGGQFRRCQRADIESCTASSRFISQRLCSGDHVRILFEVPESRRATTSATNAVFRWAGGDCVDHNRLFLAPGPLGLPRVGWCWAWWRWVSHLLQHFRRRHQRARLFDLTRGEVDPKQIKDKALRKELEEALSTSDASRWWCKAGRV